MFRTTFCAHGVHCESVLSASAALVINRSKQEGAPPNLALRSIRNLAIEDNKE